jgi:hypothetical protein
MWSFVMLERVPGSDPERGLIVMVKQSAGMAGHASMRIARHDSRYGSL